MSSVSLSPQCVLNRVQDAEINKFFRAVVKFGGSHLHLKMNRPPFVRINGSLRPMNCDPLAESDLEDMLLALVEQDERRKRVFKDEGGVDFAYTVSYEGISWRFRVNILQQSGHIGLVAARMNNAIPDFEHLNLPPTLGDLCVFSQGMILLTGSSGSGKSTTIASMVDWINHHHERHILTLEDPIEFIYADDKSVVNQREIGSDVRTFSIGMKHAVREDPDVIVVGEMRDRETFETAIQAAETGHLVFGTVHASTASSTIGRILDLFPYEMHSALRSAMAFNLRAIIAQKLLPSIVPGVGRVPCCEILTFSPTVRKLLLEEQDDKIPDAMRIGKAEGMRDFTMSLLDLTKRNMIDTETAFEVAPNAEALRMAMKGISIKESAML
jgi:twitching motility protein PilT